MKGHSDEALPLDVLASDVELDRAVRELDPRHVRDPVAGTLVQTKPFPRAVGETTHATVEDLHLPPFG
jgi:hypothetical protein